ncbi:MAG TPA: hypothetical protein VL282_01105, partial [Tepidisphaeraceae bacterium]|nr:hypothetical protein [Tepidisphaeraceae bacterium]
LQAIDIYARRLMAENFRVDLSQVPMRMVAQKQGKLGFGSTEMVTSHAKKGLLFTADFRPEGNRTFAHVELKFTEFIIVDTGETQFIEQTIDWLLGGDMSSPAARPTVANRSVFASIAMWGGFFVLAMSGLLLHPFFREGSTRNALIGGLLAACFTNLITAIWGLVGIHRAPEALTGKPLAYAAIALSVIDALVIALLAMRVM